MSKPQKNTEDLQKEIADLKQQLKAITKTLPAALMISSIKTGEIKFANDVMGKMLGISKKKLIGRTSSDFYCSKSDRTVIANSIKSKGFVENLKVEAKKEDGTSFWVSVSIESTTYKGESSMLSLFTDISAEKQTEDTLKSSQQFFGSLMESLSDFIWEVDSNGKYTFISQTVEDILGYAPEEVIGKTPFELMSDQEKERVGVIFRNSATNKEKITRLENINIHKDGRKIILETSGAPYFDDNNNVLGYRGVSRDATERKQEEQKYRSLFESSSDALMTLSDKRITDCNQATLDMFTFETKDDFIGLQPWEFSPPLQSDGSDSKEKANLIIKEALQHGSYRFEWTHRRRNGEDFPAEVLLTKTESKGKVAFQATVRDTTEQKRAEERIQAMLENMRLIFETVPVFIVNLNREDIVTYVNHGVPGSTPEDVIGTNVFEHLPPEYHQAFKEALEKVYSEGKLVEIETAVAPAGTDIKMWNLHRIVPMIKNEKTIGVAITSTDISEWVNIRAEQSRITNDLIDLIDNANAPIFGIDENGNVNEWNKMAEKITLFTKAEVLGKNLVDTYITSDYKESVRRVLNNALKEEETSNYEFPIFSKDNRRIMVLLNSSARRDAQGNIVGVLGVGQDITEIDKARAEQTRITNDLTDLIDNANAPIFGIDENGNVNEWNKMAEKITLFTKAEVLGKNLVDTYITSDYKESVRRVLNNALKEEETSNYEFPIFSKDNRRIMVLLNSSARRDAQGNIVGVLGVGQDITEIDKARAELQNERAGLKVKVAERTAELTRSLKKIATTNRELESINKHKSEFISSMSHELRTPLNGIIGTTDLLHEQLFGELNDKQLSYTSQISESAEHLLLLINEILDMAKIDSGMMELDLVGLDIDKWIRGAIGIIQAEFDKKEIAVIVLNDSDKKSMMADSRKCNQIMLNLLSNALKYSPVGKHITVQISDESESMLRVEVHDQGIGIEDEDFDSIFSEFYQVDRVRDEQMGGTGIGLALTRRLVEMHKGAIGVERSKEGGALFWFTLPASLVQNIEPEEAQIPEEITISNVHKEVKILIVEDNEKNVNIMLDMLDIFDYDLAIAKNGQIAVDMVETYKPDIILMDMRMPVMDGIEATKRIKAMPGFEEIPIVAITASVTESSKEVQQKIGCADHISKPFKRSELLATLSKHL